MPEDLTNIKNYCCSCGERIDFGKRDIYDYYCQFGNYCQACNNKISKNADIRHKERQKHLASGVKRNLPLV
jgi:hypothetical protein